MDAAAEALVDAVERALPDWVARVVVERGGAGVRDEARLAGVAARDEVGAELRALLSLDIDEQRTTPLAVLRAAVRYPTAALRAAGVEPVRRDRFAEEAFPDDVYDLTPATWADLGPEVADAGIAWGAWKAMAHRARHAT